ncbi:GNAT family N-acetyltransferase [Piscinibacter defluvii]|uniref:GNAT family N-acetyltransferase n=1 Tax=Piscinibacter defluvii TaxID=1796922 RepID=UPI000FDD2670|nr:GNAT family N-acetyltransferase [Piscinibacter defluvii]
MAQMINGSNRSSASDVCAAVPAVQTPAADAVAPLPNGRHDLELLRGQAAQEVLAAPALRAQWLELHAQCPTATVFQAPGFVCAWYQSYARDWEPVLVLSRGESGRLRGLWTLARSVRSGMLTHAGAHQAEYHGWLSPPGEDACFVAAAWRALSAALPVAELRFRYLPARSLLEALDADPWLHERLRWRAVARPLMRLEANEVRASMAKKSNKSRLNRLKRLGTLEFRAVCDGADLDRVLPSLMAYYDFRQGAINQSSPFREDDRKRQFHEALFAAGAPTCHVTLTCLDEVPIAAFFGAVSGRTLHLGMLIHSPMLAEHSPGKLHLLQLAECLLQSGIDTIDLTPGGDAWKERFANAHDEVYELSLFARPFQAWRRDVRTSLESLLKSALVRVSLRPAQLRSMLGRLRRLRPLELVRRLRREVSERRELRIYRIEAEQAKALRRDPRVAVNAIDELVTFEPGEPWQTRQGFLSAALSRIESGERAYTISVDGRLAHSGWLVARQELSRMSEVDQTLRLPADSATLYDFYTDPECRGRGLYGTTIDHMLVDAFADPSLKYAYICVLADNKPSRKVIERAGFQYLGSFHWHRWLGRQRKFADPCFALPAEQDAAT